MGIDEQVPVANSATKSPMQSKKFVAFLVAEMTWKIIIAIVVALGMKNGDIHLMLGAVVLLCVAIAGFIEAGYIIGQASLDKYLGLAQIAADAGQGIVLPKGASLASRQPEITPPEEEPPSQG